MLGDTLFFAVLPFGKRRTYLLLKSLNPGRPNTGSPGFVPRVNPA